MRRGNTCTQHTICFFISLHLWVASPHQGLAWGWLGRILAPGLTHLLGVIKQLL